jgi:hypothetical protein
MRKIFNTTIFILMTALIIFNFSACSSQNTKVYECEAGLSITLPDGFIEKDLMMATYYLQSENALFLAIKESFSDLAIVSINGNSTLTDYAEVVIYQNALDTSIHSEESIVYFTYSKNVSGKTFFYFATVEKGSDSFWLCQFACLNSEKDNYQQTFIDWSKTITVS